MSARTAVAAFLVLVGAGASYGHGAYDWIREHGYTGVNNDLCCGENDCYHLKMVAHAVETGWRLDFEYKGREYSHIVPDRAVYKSENNEDWLCLMFLSGQPVVRCAFLAVTG